jgi:hypothetical protein
MPSVHFHGIVLRHKETFFKIWVLWKFNYYAYVIQGSVLHVTGCIGLLARWKQHPNIRLSIPATRALANLDVDDAPEIKFSSHLHLLYPTVRRTDSPKLDVVFIHGLLGGVFFTWRQRVREETSLSMLRKYVTFLLISIYCYQSLGDCML